MDSVEREDPILRAFSAESVESDVHLNTNEILETMDFGEGGSGNDQPKKVENDGKEIKAAEEDGDSDDEEEDCESTPDGQYQVEKILSMRTRKGEKEYLIRWLGYPEEDNTWEPEFAIHCTEMLDAFKKEHERNKRQSTGKKTQASKRETKKSTEKKPRATRNAKKTEGPSLKSPSPEASTSQGRTRRSRSISTAPATPKRPKLDGPNRVVDGGNGSDGNGVASGTPVRQESESNVEKVRDQSVEIAPVFSQPKPKPVEPALVLPDVPAVQEPVCSVNPFDQENKHEGIDVPEEKHCDNSTKEGPNRFPLRTYAATNNTEVPVLYLKEGIMSGIKKLRFNDFDLERTFQQKKFQPELVLVEHEKINLLAFLDAARAEESVYIGFQEVMPEILVGFTISAVEKNFPETHALIKELGLEVAYRDLFAKLS